MKNGQLYRINMYFSYRIICSEQMFDALTDGEGVKSIAKNRLTKSQILTQKQKAPMEETNGRN